MAIRCLRGVQDFRAGKGITLGASYIISGIVKECLPHDSSEERNVDRAAGCHVLYVSE
jgi:hypothetical protein